MFTVTSNYTLRTNLTSTVYSGPATYIATGDGSTVVNTTGSNNGISQSIVSGSWVQINTGSCTNLAYVYFQNMETSSNWIDIGIPVGTTTASIAALGPLEFMVLPPTASEVFYAKSRPSQSFASALLNVVMADA